MRHIPKAGAVCGNSARTDLCGGQGVTSVPTATIIIPRPHCFGIRKRSLIRFLGSWSTGHSLGGWVADTRPWRWATNKMLRLGAGRLGLGWQ